MYMLNGWWFLSSGGSYPPVFTVAFWLSLLLYPIVKLHHQFLLLHCFQYISEEKDSLETQPCICVENLYANNFCKSCRMSRACSLHTLL